MNDIPDPPPEPAEEPSPPRHDGSALRQAVLFPNFYVWLFFLSSLDIMLTWIVLYWGGQEVNVLADWVVQRWGLPGMVTFKFVLVTFVVCICEIVGRRNHATGRKLAEWAVAISTIPVALAFVLLLVRVYG